MVALAALVLVVVLAVLLGYLSDHAAAASNGACATVVVSIDWDHKRAGKVSGVVVRVRYPRSVELPLDAARPGSAQDRVELLTGTSGGLFDAVPRDGDGDGRNDVVSVGLITQGIPSGRFARVGFECATGTASARASDFSCVSDIADESGSVPSSCSVALAAD